MIFFVGLCLALAFSWFGSRLIKRRAVMLYWIAAALSLLTVAIAHSGVTVAADWIFSLLSSCALATAFFAVVMYMAILPRGGTAVKRLLPIRGELSILACILTLGHNLTYGKTYFFMLLTRPERLSGNLLVAAILSAVLAAIMIPLFVTSFPAVRKKMKARKWKKLQRLAYWFYALVYVHVMLLARELDRWDNILVYSAVFLPYGILRLRKALRNHPLAAKKITAGLTIGAVALVVLMCVPTPAPEPVPQEPVEPKIYVDGMYFGSGEGYVGETQVAVTVSGGRIQSVIVVSSKDDAPYMEDAKALIPGVIDAQHTHLNAISGATYTSQAILEAIEDALKEAER